MEFGFKNTVEILDIFELIGVIHCYIFSADPFSVGLVTEIIKL